MEHVGADVSGPCNLLSGPACHLEPVERRRDQLTVDSFEIDFILYPKGTYDKGVQGGLLPQVSIQHGEPVEVLGLDLDFGDLLAHLLELPNEFNGIHFTDVLGAYLRKA